MLYMKQPVTVAVECLEMVYTIMQFSCNLDHALLFTVMVMVVQNKSLGVILLLKNLARYFLHTS